MREFVLEHFMDLNPAETPSRLRRHNLQLSLVEAWHIFNSRGDASLVSLALGNRVIYDEAALLALMNRISETTNDGTDVEQIADQICRERTIDKETFQSICDEVRQRRQGATFEDDDSLQDGRRAAIGEVLGYARQYLGNDDPGAGVPPSGGSNFCSRYNALASLVEHRASPHFNAITVMEEFMEQIFGVGAWVEEPANN